MTTKHRGEGVSNLIHLLPGSLLIYFDVNDLQPKGLWSYMYTFPVFWNPEGRKTPFIRKFYYVFSCKQGVIDTVKVGGNHYGFRSRLANFFYIRQIHDQSAERRCRLTAVYNYSIWLVPSDYSFYF